MRLYEKSAMGRILELLDRCVQALVQMAKDNNKVPMPGFTHTRKAMLSSVDQWAAGYAELLVLQGSDSRRSLCLQNQKLCITRCPLIYTTQHRFTHTRKAMLSSVDQWAAGYAELLGLQAEASAGVTALQNQKLCITRCPLIYTTQHRFTCMG